MAAVRGQLPGWSRPSGALSPLNETPRPSAQPPRWPAKSNWTPVYADPSRQLVAVVVEADPLVVSRGQRGDEAAGDLQPVPVGGQRDGRRRLTRVPRRCTSPSHPVAPPRAPNVSGADAWVAPLIVMPGSLTRSTGRRSRRRCRGSSVPPAAPGASPALRRRRDGRPSVPARGTAARWPSPAAPRRRPRRSALPLSGISTAAIDIGGQREGRRGGRRGEPGHLEAQRRRPTVFQLTTMISVASSAWLRLA